MTMQTVKTPILMAVLHGSEGWKRAWAPREKRAARRAQWWQKYAIEIVFPRIDYSGAWFEPKGARAETEKDFRQLQAELHGALAAHGDNPVALVGFSRGGFLAHYAAQRLREVGFVLNIMGSLTNREVVEGRWERAGVEQWVAVESAVLAERAADNKPGAWIYGSADTFTPLEDARRMHEAAGRRQDFVVLEGLGHRWPDADDWCPKVLEWANRVRGEGA